MTNTGMNKGQIVIASVLKPVDDTRLFEKFGISLSQTNKYDVNIIGFYSKKTISYPNVSFHPIFKFKRTSVKRLFASWKYYKTLLKVKPDVVIVSSPELMIVTVLYKILFGAKLSYDIQENYFNNILYTNTYPLVIKHILAYGVRLIEILLNPFVDLYLLAEKCYEQEIHFVRGKFVIVENKFRPIKPIIPSKSLDKLPKIELLYTGTISYNYGVMEAIHFTNNFSKMNPDVSLRIIGHCPLNRLHQQLTNLSLTTRFLRYEGESSPIPHSNIIAAISEADFALLPYQPDKSIENCFPTKIWEYIAHRLPMIIQEHEPWVSYCDLHQACLPIDFKNYHINVISEALLARKFYQNSKENGFLWDSEELTLLHAITKLYNHNNL